MNSNSSISSLKMAAANVVTPEPSEQLQGISIPSSKLHSSSTVYENQSETQSGTHTTSISKVGQTTLTKNVRQVQKSRLLRKRRPALKSDFTYHGLKNDENDSSDEFQLKKAKGKTFKASQSKKTTKKAVKIETSHDNQRLVPPGISVFDLIMPWKNDIVKQDTSNLDKNKLSEVHNITSKVQTQDLAKYAHDVQAVLINPPWNCNQSNSKQPKKKQKSITIDDFKCLNIPVSVMKDGLVFVWVDKEIISDLIKHMEAQDLYYVENVCYIMLDQNKKKNVDDSRQIDISSSYIKESYQYLHKSKKTMLIFRRISNKKAKCTLELRHQRTCDVCFDWGILNNSPSEYAKEDKINNDSIERNSQFKPNNYIYKMIETMLPKAMVDEQKKHIRLLELWAINEDPRRGWVKLVQK